MKKLPIGTQSFERLITEDFLYIDKTDLIYQLITTGRSYLFTRPQKFGKSLLISTLEAIFRGKRKLFKNLWLDKEDYQWVEYPIIKIDFSVLPNDTAGNLECALLNKLQDIAASYNITLSEHNNLKLAFEETIKLLSSINKVVILIDEYDKPISDHITELKIADSNNMVMRSFFSIIKPCDEYIKFVMLTGVSKFNGVSALSDLNSLNDISMRYDYTTLLGYTAEEIEEYLMPYIEKLAEAEDLTIEQTKQKIKYWYEGYQFSKYSKKLYQPASILLTFSNLEFKNYHYNTIPPNLLLDLIASEKYDITTLESQEVDELSITSYAIDNIKLRSLLFHQGYLTIKSFNRDRMLYQLTFPNLEVKDYFNKFLLELFTQVKKETINNSLWKCIDAVNKDDIQLFFAEIKNFFIKITPEIKQHNINFHASIIHILFLLLGLKATASVIIKDDKFDAAIENDYRIYLIRFTLNGFADSELKQMKEKRYYQKHLNLGKEIKLLAVDFNQTTFELNKHAEYRKAIK